MNIHTIGTEKLVKNIYSTIESEIDNLQHILNAKDVGGAFDSYHNNEWDVDDYANISACCAIIQVMLDQLKELKIHKDLRDATFEQEAGNWAFI